MRKIIKITVLITSIILIFNGNLLCNTCKIDSIDNIKYEYNDLNKVNRIWYEVYSYPDFIEATLYKDVNYNDNNLIESLTTYTIDNSGDTISGPFTYTPFEYTDTLITKIVNSSVIYDDFVYNDNNQIIEFKYYYIEEGEIDSSQTRILNFTYSEGNIINSIYKQLEGNYIFHNYDWEYDDKINPYYHNEIALISGDLIKYSCKNNWTFHSGTGNYATTANRLIDYNEFNFPIKIETTYDNGNNNIVNIKYDCISDNIPNTIKIEDLILYPNPSSGIIYFENIINNGIQNINIYNMYGQREDFQVLHNKIVINSTKTGFKIIEIETENKLYRNKFFIYAP